MPESPKAQLTEFSRTEKEMFEMQWLNLTLKVRYKMLHHNYPPYISSYF
jgi:hypothetical protein